MSSIATLIITVLAFCSVSADTQLEDLAQSILESLKTDLSGGQSGGNSPLLSFTNGEHLTYDLLVGKNASEKIKVKVTFSGQIKVEAEKDTKKVNVSHTYSGVAAFAENETESADADRTEPEELAESEISQIINPVLEKHQLDQTELDDNEVGVILEHGAKTGVKVHAGKRHADAKIRGGFVVGVKTKVTKNF